MSTQATLDQITRFQKTIANAKAKLIEQNNQLKRLSEPPFAFGIVICVSPVQDTHIRDFQVGKIVRINQGPDAGLNGVIVAGLDRDGDVRVQSDVGNTNWYRVSDNNASIELVTHEFGTATIVIDGRFMVVNLPKEIEIQPGDTVKVSVQSMQIISKSGDTLGGSISYIRNVIDPTYSEVDIASSTQVVFNGKFSGQLEKGDRVVIDSTGTIIIKNLGKDDERFRFEGTSHVHWNDIGGLEEAKQSMIEAVELPHRNPEVFKRYGKKPIKGILLYGPPGCGKTMLAKATAHSLAETYAGRNAHSGFIYIKGPEILDRYVGVAEATIRQIFDQARTHKSEYGYPAVIFIDEADAILSKRGTGISSDIERTIVPMFLAEMDGLEDSSALIILATNRSDILDPAIVRDGRIDRKVKVTRPTPQSAVDIFKLNLTGVPLMNGYTPHDIAQLGTRELFSKERVLYRVETRSKGQIDFTLGHLVNGGMVVSAVDQATSIALHRDLASGSQGGLSMEDMVAAIDAIQAQNMDLNHKDELSEFTQGLRNDIVGVYRVRQEIN